MAQQSSQSIPVCPNCLETIKTFFFSCSDDSLCHEKCFESSDVLQKVTGWQTNTVLQYIETLILLFISKKNQKDSNEIIYDVDGFDLDCF